MRNYFYNTVKYTSNVENVTIRALTNKMFKTIFRAFFLFVGTRSSDFLVYCHGTDETEVMLWKDDIVGKHKKNEGFCTTFIGFMFSTLTANKNL